MAKIGKIDSKGRVFMNIPCEKCKEVQSIETVVCASCAKKAEIGPNDVTDLQLFLERMSPMFGNEFGVWIVGRDQASRKRLRCKIVFDEVPVEECSSVSENFRLKNSDVQRIMDNLWAAGVRPSSGDGNEGALKATQNHLLDVRGVMNRLLEVAVPLQRTLDGKVIEPGPYRG